VKLLLKSILAIVALLVVVVIALVLFFDPNMFKPRIEAMAREQGVALEINGDLGWRLWPSFGVEVNDIRLAATSAPTLPIAQLQQASFLLAVKPLLSGEIIVHHLLVDGAAIELSVDAQGTGNWEALTAEPLTSTSTPIPTDESATEAAAPTTTDAAEQSGKPMQLAVEKIGLHNSSLSYRDAQTGQQITVQNIQLDIDEFNLQGQPFEMTLSLLTRISNSTQNTDELAATISLAHQLQLTQELNAAQLTDGRLTLDIEGAQTVSLKANYALSATDLQNEPAFDGQIKIDSFDAKKLLRALGSEIITAENYALTDVSLQTSFKGTAQALAFDPLKITLDKTTITGSAAITDIATNAMTLTFKGDQINVDDYLAPTEEENATTASTATGDEELIPLDTLKTLNADIQADFTQVTVADIPLKNISLRATAKNGLVELSTAQADVYNGLVAASGTLDGRGDTAVIRFNGKVDKVQLEPFFADMELNEKINFTGALNATATGNTRGITFNQLLNALTADANISGAQVRFFPLNIEQKFCQMVNLINKAEAPQKDWPGFTEMKDLSGKITMAKRIITLESFNAGIEQLLLSTNGTVNLATDQYDFRLPLKLVPSESTTTTDGETTAAATSIQGCIIGNNYWLNRSLSLLRCHGSLAEMNPVSDCRPDSKALTSLTKDFAEHKLREKHGDKIEATEKKIDKKKDELRQKLNEKLGGGDEESKAGGLLKNLLKKKSDEQ